jgi:predicted ATPase
LLQDKQALLVLDNCEHLIEAVAVLTERIFAEAPGVHILATGREPVRATGEWVHRLSPLEIPPVSPAPSAAEALSFSAIQLFTQRAMASLETFRLTDANAPIVADICRRVDGIPLAIELAAGRVDSFGIQELADRLGDQLSFLTKGRRTALPRHQTMRATLTGAISSCRRPNRCCLVVWRSFGELLRSPRPPRLPPVRGSVRRMCSTPLPIWLPSR